MEGVIIGRPTLLATFDGRLDVEQIVSSLGRVGYPAEDIAVYYRPVGSDQVIDARTGQVAPGQSLIEGDLSTMKLQTLVLMHPTSEQLPVVEQALSTIGPADIKYEGETRVEGGSGDAPPPAE